MKDFETGLKKLVVVVRAEAVDLSKNKEYDVQGLLDIVAN